MSTHNESALKTIQLLNSNPSSGLTESQVQERRVQYGENKLREQKKKSSFSRFLDQFKDAMIVILNAVMGVLQESKAEKALDALKSLSTLFGLIPLSANLYLKGLGLILVPVLIMELSKACGLIRHHH